MKVEYSSRVYLIGVFSALASMLQLFEIFVIMPIPFVKIGLANAIVLFFIMKKQYLIAFAVNIIRVFIGGFFSGKLFSLPFIFSLSGALLSFSVMFTLFFIFRKHISAVALSICGAVSFNMAQYLLFMLFFDGRAEYGITVSVIAGLSVIPGILTGTVAEILNRQDIELIKKAP
ncbi:MAG: Gx transporter family protein [Candidatus Delongbacteria bacterium]